MTTMIPPDVAAKRRSIADLVPTATIKLGEKADWVAITDDAVWIGTVGPNALQRLDPGSGAIVSVVELPGRPLAGLALGFGALWAPLCGDAPSLARVDLATGALSAVYPLPFVAAEGGVTTGAGSVWLAIDEQGTLARIDPHCGAIQHRIPTAPGSYNPIFHDGRMWITQAEGSCVSVVDPGANAVIAQLATGPGPRFIGASADSIWTLNQGDGSLTRVHARTQAVLSTEPLATPGLGGDIAVGAGMVWTSVRGVPLSATDAVTGKLLRQWAGPGGDSVGIGHGAIWLIHCRGGEVSRIDLGTALAQCRD